MSKFEQARSKSKLNKTDLIEPVFGSHEHYNKLLAYLHKFKSLASHEEHFKFYELSREDQIKYSYSFAAKLIENKMFDFINGDVPSEMNFYNNFEIPASVSNIMVRPVIDILGSDEQRKEWLPLIDAARCIGAYAQTELGHGSDVQGLETEAVYDAGTKEFIIHNKEVKSYKWWPGELGYLSNIAVVYCKTIVNGNSLGVFPFVVPIRDMETHKVLEGVHVGDIGPKFGFSAKENGYLYFKNFRVPKRNLLNRFFDIDDEGNMEVKGNPKIVYAAMMKVRIFMLSASAHHLGKGLAIAIRYSHLRQQFTNSEGQEEFVINYQLQQHKLFPLLAKSYAMITGYQRILQVVNQVNEDRLQNKFTRLQECHILLAGAKALYTAWCNSGLVTCLQCCGGHGFSSFSGIPPMIQSALPNAIMEGDISILLIQVGRYLIKCVGHIKANKLSHIKGHVEYLKDYKNLEVFEAKADKGFLSDLANILTLFKKCSFLLCVAAAEHLAASSKESNSTDAFNKSSAIRVCDAAKIHVVTFTLDYFVSLVDSSKTDALKASFGNLAMLFALDQIFENASLFSITKTVNGSTLKILKELYEEVLAKLLPDALVLVEGFVPDDFVLHSAIADSNEKPYENLYSLAKKVTMTNQVDLSSFYLRTIREASIKAYPRL